MVPPARPGPGRRWFESILCVASDHPSLAPAFERAVRLARADEAAPTLVAGA